MANYAKLELTWAAESEIGDVLAFSSTLNGLRVTETGASVRATPFQFTITDALEPTSNGYYNALLADYGGYFNLSREGNSEEGYVITIEAVDYSDHFTALSFPANITAVYTESSEPLPVFNVTSVTAEQADAADRNTHARFNITVAYGASDFDITAPVVKLAEFEEDLFFDYLRQPPLPLVNLAITDSDDFSTTYPMPTVDQWTISACGVIESADGATVTANTSTVLGDISTIKEYSLDQIVWYSQASFTGILAGSYTMYVRDNFGAVQSIGFEIVGISADKPDAYFNIPKANPLRFVPVTNFDDCNNIANWDNALFSELKEQGKFPNVEWQPYNQLISECDIITNQINTNYDNISILATDCEGNELNLTHTKIVDNILLEDLRDCSFRPISSAGSEYDGKTLMYFTGGNTYDVDTTLSNGSYSNPTKGLFQFAKVGTLFTITGTTLLNGSYSTLGTYKDQNTGYWGVVLDLTFTGNDPTTGIIRTSYNKLDYNVYEFSLVGSALTLGNIYSILISATDDNLNYPDVSWHSEPIKKVSTKNTVIFDYSNDENTGELDFTTGSVFRLRLASRFIDGVISEDSDDFQTDYGKKTILKTLIRTSFNFEGMLYPFYIVRKIAYASGMSNLLINNVKFVRGESLEVESRISERNPFQKVNRSYQQDSESITTYSGLVTESQQVIGSSTEIAIGDNI